MEEYTQITLTEWLSWKEDIRRKLQETASNKSINSKIDDINKYDLFFVNEDMFKHVDLDDPNILEQVKSKDKKEIVMIKDKKDSENEKPYFDNNSIDGLSLDA